VASTPGATALPTPQLLELLGRGVAPHDRSWLRRRALFGGRLRAGAPALTPAETQACSPDLRLEEVSAGALLAAHAGPPRLQIDACEPSAMRSASGLSREALFLRGAIP
jgi:hypothetical protein